jgi:uncharacterized protein YjbI with pentapeptide repeats
MMEIRVTAKQGKPREIQEVTSDLRNSRFQPHARWINFSARCERVDFSGCRFEPFHALNAAFVECDFSRARLKNASMGIEFRERAGWSRQVLYRDCRFDQADMRALPHIGNARFERCSFRETRMEGWRADRAEFIDCVFAGRMYDCRFAGRPWTDEDGATGRERNEFSGNDFREAELAAVAFVYGIDLTAQLLPEGDRYLLLDRPVERLDRVRAQIARWPQDDVREYALANLQQVMISEGEREQTIVLLDRALFSNDRIFPGTTERILDMLERALD